MQVQIFVMLYSGLVVKKTIELLR
ncbi:hypothetical protein XFF1815_900303 [Xanthomonas citri pv. fuscans]|nr:hypothetical protein XFF1815_900303 [Xanthomonas citri pv. fuscans]